MLLLLCCSPTDETVVGGLESVVHSLSFGCPQCYGISISRVVHPEEEVFAWSAKAGSAEPCLPFALLQSCLQLVASGCSCRSNIDLRGGGSLGKQRAY